MSWEIGYNHPVEVRRETCVAPCKSAFSVLYLSDFHFNARSGPMAARIADIIERLNPDVVLLGGDYADTAKGLRHLSTLASATTRNRLVLAVAGNHDRWRSGKGAKAVLEAAGVVWIGQASHSFMLRDTRIRVDGNLPCASGSDAEVAILCLHKPVDISPYSALYHLAFAGHLHGGQFVFWKNEKGLFPGILLYRMNKPDASIAGCRYLISKGLGDTLPLRYNCPRDVLFVEVIPELARPERTNNHPA